MNSETTRDPIATSDAEHLQRSQQFTKSLRIVLGLRAFIALVPCLLIAGSDFAYSTADSVQGLVRYPGATAGLLWLMLWLTLNVVSIPLVIAHAVIARRYGVMKSSLWDALQMHMKQVATFGVAGFVASVVVYYSMDRWSDLWWVAAALTTSMLIVLYIEFFPRLMMSRLGPVEIMESGTLRSSLESLAQRAHINVDQIFWWRISRKSTICNAVVAGLWRRNVYITDTLPDVCSETEIVSLFAHELGHIANRDVWKRAGALIATQFAVFAAIRYGAAFLMPRVAIEEPAYLPGLYAAFVILSIYTRLVVAYSARKQERAADHYACELMQDGSEFANALEKVTQRNLIHVGKGVRYSHPATKERIDAARAFSQKRSVAISAGQN